MRLSIVELLPDLLELSVFGVGSAGLSVAGAYIERFGLLTVEHGNTELGAWAVVMGLAVLYFAYLLGTDKFWPKLRAVRADLT
ncbi:hypothetical protein E6P09_01925 [Haloferax mediterranei ATCC 33500]|uniref:DUF8151 domain-containing protein n=1 Tax=Haloferax mediterranei (strain ATCC 33500 / DSM 1411 / JCM 8866 / NBRC 14739 / NCIMB 2177 / R-4) TaxID=523841 RepID=I3R5Z0_HALMT|nr:hypothetical protein [Haloferax mediterranei]AFK19650.1 hypothetical protein HFX_1954 [Haloferax mediterranei ATCC 33500]AHZ23038.1 hypothetical protein BM92_10490 [Haloferax mediterranei ATCC 33500]ELZ99968.1 hypothetical protein C439_11553 [Haloferax mediterranei ATCC 33500]MDX5987610.1 hypothetical protein [Haloferax mediterranei ATCC 33500]QCQ74097.1 hypothetical protein E6P09_01925 [Haloferax mediterranei ATCC 33500]